MSRPDEAWRLLVTWEGEPGANMALDEALLRSAERRPTLRLYTWRPDAVSMGYFQRYGDVAPAVSGRAACLVRRLTGGGAIHHARELTFSVTSPLDHPLYRGAIADSYARVHALVARALAELGVDAIPRGGGLLTSDREESVMCFHRSTPADLTWNERKGVGSAQRRRKGRVLHHGSIKIGVPPLEEGAASLAAPGVDAARVGEALVGSFEQGLGAQLEREDPTDAELEHARDRASFFRSDAFLRRR